jgi:hypothetical protein
MNHRMEFDEKTIRKRLTIKYFVTGEADHLLHFPYFE